MLVNAASVEITIHMAGSIDTAKVTLRRFCYEVGRCVTISPETFIYTGGEEEGFRVGLVSYPRFPSNAKKLQALAIRIARSLITDCCQKTALVVGPELTTWLAIDPPGAS
jgi:hypothetical protein